MHTVAHVRLPDWTPPATYPALCPPHRFVRWMAHEDGVAPARPYPTAIRARSGPDRHRTGGCRRRSEGMRTDSAQEHRDEVWSGRGRLSVAGQ